MTTTDGPTVRRRRLGQLLRECRDATGMTCEQVGRDIGISTSKVSRIEIAKSPAVRRDVIALLRLYGVGEDTDIWREAMDLLRDAKTPGWWHEYSAVLPRKYSHLIALEAEAAELCNWEPSVLPGLLQTEDYARASIRKTMPDAAADEVEARVEVRMKRQEVHARTSDPLRLRVVIDEAALHRNVGGAKVMADQLLALVDAAARPNVRLQVLPFETGALAVVTGPFVLIEFADSSARPVGYLENAAGDLYLEKPMQIQRHKLLFDELCADALGADESAEMIRRMVTNYT
jgi:transcriptional regulator with XRE-family HTH domain